MRERRPTVEYERSFLEAPTQSDPPLRSSTVINAAALMLAIVHSPSKEVLRPLYLLHRESAWIAAYMAL